MKVEDTCLLVTVYLKFPDHFCLIQDEAKVVWEFGKGSGNETSNVCELWYVRTACMKSKTKAWE